ncbi:MAG: glycoside hydrolase family 65 protein [Bacillota bacterium]
MYTAMKYDMGKDDCENWIIAETAFDYKHLGKCEVIMSTGNGYLGLRSAHEEAYVGETRNMFVSGTFNKAFENEVTELPNAADVTSMNIEINDVSFNLLTGTIIDYSRTLNLKTGEVIRSVIWESPKGDTVRFTFRRFTSLKDLHLIGQRVEIEPISGDIRIRLKSGIDGRVTNSGTQHFIEIEKRLYENQFLQILERTNESSIDFIINTTHGFFRNNNGFKPGKPLIRMERRRLYQEFCIDAVKGEGIAVEKLSNVYTSRDKDMEGHGLSDIRKISLESLKAQASKGYAELLRESSDKWLAEIWSRLDISIQSENSFDQLAIRFAIYHMTVMTPSHDSRMGIGATGLCGEGYKGHSFWDTELFILPYWIYNNPKVARGLLEYRYMTLPAARRKAAQNGLSGAQFPWESAWLEDGDVTPSHVGVDIITGVEEKVWGGIRALHISADIAYAVWHYYRATGDEDFMNSCGYEIIFETARFWQSRLEWKESSGNYQLTEVMGPDEYKEKVNNNAYTNYMAYWNIKLAKDSYEVLKETNPELLEKLSRHLKLRESYHQWAGMLDLIYLPKANEELIIPQDDDFLSHRQIDLSKYKNQNAVNSIRDDFNLSELYELQVCKQADTLILFYLLEDMFDYETKLKNFYYYEARCLHDSSLSLSFHCILASDIREMSMAYKLFEKAAAIDLGPVMSSSNNGIHAASTGGIWQCVVNGFGGVRIKDNKLHIEPKLPEQWHRLRFPLMWKGDLLRIEITKEIMIIENTTRNNDEIILLHNGLKHSLKDKIVLYMTNS